MTRVLAWQDKKFRRRMFDGQTWFDVEPGEVVVIVVGRDLDNRLLAALGLTETADPEPTE